MKRALKADIMTTARDLFGQRGYNNVSLRDIAEVLEISVGNLTYHYPRKEDLIEAVITEQHKAYQPPAPARDLPALHEFFSRQFRFQSERRYYFRHYAQLADTCPRIFEIQSAVWHDVYTFLRQSLLALEDIGVLAPPLLPGQREGLLHAIMLICVQGEPYFERLGVADSVQTGLGSLWGIVAPNLTPMGLAQLRELNGQ